MKHKLRDYLYALVIFLLGQVLFAALIYSSVSAFKDSAQLQIQLLNASQLSEKINLNASFSRDIYNIPSLKTDLKELIDSTSSTSGLVIDKKGKVLCSYGSPLYYVDTTLIKQHAITIDSKIYAVSATYNDNEISGYVMLALKDKSQADFNLMHDFLHDLIFICAISSVIFTIIYLLLNKYSGLNCIKPARIFLVSFVLCQSINAALMLNSLKPMVDAFTNDIEYYSSASLNKNLHRISYLKLSFDDVSGIDQYFENIKSKVESVGYIALTDRNANIIAGDKEALDGVRRPVMKSGSITGFSWIKSSESFVENIYIKLAIDFLTLIVISSIFANELKSLLHFELVYQDTKSSKSPVPFDPLIIRPLSFCLIFGMFLTLTLIPLRIVTLDTSFFNMDQNLIMSLPVTTEVLAIGLASFILLFYSAKFGNWRKILPFGIFCICLAAFVSGIATNALTYMAGRFIYGFGYGFVLLGCQLFVMHNSHAHNRGEALSSFSVGSFSGILCGCAAGGMIAERINIQSVFFISSAITLLCLLYVLYLISKRVDAVISTYKASVLKLSQICAYLKHKDVLTLLIFHVIPYSAISIGIFNFFLPVLIAKEGFSLSVAGQINIIHSCSVIFLAPVFGRMLDTVKYKYRILGPALMLSALAPLLLNIDNALLAAILTMLALGLSSSVNDSGQVTYISTLPCSQDFGQSESVILLDAIYRIGQILGPSIFAVGVALSADMALYVISGVVFICACMFLVLNAGSKNATTT